MNRTSTTSIRRRPSARPTALPASVYEQVVEQSEVGILITDVTGAVKYANAALRRWVPAAWVKPSARLQQWALACGQQSSIDLLHDERLLHDQLCSLPRVDEEPLSLRVTRRTDEAQASGELVFFTFTNISEEMQAKAHTRHVAEHDHLTGLPNRLLLHTQLTDAIARSHRSGRQVAVLMLDLDHFKRINDSLGHHTGDELLKAVSQRIKSCVRDTDTVARMGGDEFVVVLPDLTDTEIADDIAVKIISRVMAPIQLGPYELVVTPSIGISRSPSDGSNATLLLKFADAAMYRAKARGRCRYEQFDPETEAQAVASMGLEAELRKGLRDNQLELHYQPQICLNTGRITGVEALVRWRHPQRGMIPPDQFIPLAEQCGLIVALGEQVLRMACRDARQIQLCARHPVAMAVNLSPLQFRNTNLVQVVRSALLEGCLSPELLELEITESALMENYDEACLKLQDLRNLGVSLSIDDFGTGFSSLAHLSRLPINALKIDRSFTGNMMVNRSDAVIVQAIVAMARSLSLRVVAEGVETRDQLTQLIQQQCDLSQGYLFSKALPINKLCGNGFDTDVASENDPAFIHIERRGVHWVTGSRHGEAAKPTRPNRANRRLNPALAKVEDPAASVRVSG